MEIGSCVVFVDLKGKALRRINGPGVSSIPKQNEGVVLVSKTGANNWYVVASVIHHYETSGTDTYHKVIVFVKQAKLDNLERSMPKVVEFVSRFR